MEEIIKYLGILLIAALLVRVGTFLHSRYQDKKRDDRYNKNR